MGACPKWRRLRNLHRGECEWLRALIERIERAALWAWPPRETARDDGWLLRAAGGAYRRVNSVQALVFAADSDVERAVGRVERWYAASRPAGLLPAHRAGRPRPAFDAVLDARGYRVLPSVSVLLVDAASVAPPPRARIELQTRPTPQVMNAICDPYWEAATRRARAELFARIRRPHVFAVLLEGVASRSAGGLCVVDGDLAGIFCLRTAVPARGRGLGSAVLRRLMAWARDNGATQIYLQVEDDNVPAQALHRQLAGERAYGYWYREAGAQAA